MSLGVLIGYEYSGTVRDQFLARGFDAWSCDLKPTDSRPDRHFQFDIRAAIAMRRWSLIVLHIECTAMANCGNKHYGKDMPKHAKRIAALADALEVWDLACAHADHVAMENPASTLFPMLRRERCVDVQYVQPYQFGHMEQKKTGFALHNLPRLKPTNDVYAQMMLLPKRERENVSFIWLPLRNAATSVPDSIPVSPKQWATNGECTPCSVLQIMGLIRFRHRKCNKCR